MTSLLLSIVIESISCWVKDTVVRKTSGTATWKDGKLIFNRASIPPPRYAGSRKGRCRALPSVRAGRVNCCNVL